ncbi:MAG: hypothetical protein GX601_13130 [Anaerolineales bacterium]|nr:hypothetical protein [Anaerolineales bacterium]
MIALSLHPPRFRPLPLGGIHPTGWLARQLQIQAEGISGHLDEFWPDVRDSRWFGGDAEGWERAPYWLDGVIPLAFLLNDAWLVDKVTRYVTAVLDHKAEDGWLGPRAMVVLDGAQEIANYDLWGQLLATKALAQYGDATGDPRIPEALVQAFRCMDRHIDRSPLFNWGQFRWFEGLIALFWLYERTGEPWLLDLAVKLHAQGFHWGDFFARWPLAEPTPKGRWNFAGHVVNNAQALKAHGLWWRVTGSGADLAAVDDMIAKLDRYHGQATGVFTGDECLAGRRPTQGTELCAVVEHAYSLEVLTSITGNAAYADRLERIVFNALPATFSPDMWAHQYDQQANQIECSVRPDWPWNTNGPESNIFGVDPNYGCCTANLSQGWPKFTAHLWMKPTDEDGLAAVAYAPSRAELEINGVPVTATLDTDYPFRQELRFRITTASPLRFPLLLRIPAWAEGATVQISGEAASSAAAGGFYRLEQEWRGATELKLTLPMRPGLWQGYRGAVALERGPLVYALKIGDDWRRVHAERPYRELPHADWEVYPTTPWNYALQVSAETLTQDVTFEAHPVGDCPFSPEGAPVSAHVLGRRLAEWQRDTGSAADAPESPVHSSAPLEELTLIPYGCTNLRITEFPQLTTTKGVP